MYKNLRWKVLTIVAVLVVFFGIGVYPMLAAGLQLAVPGVAAGQALKLGLDLKGGVQLRPARQHRRRAADLDDRGQRAAARVADEARGSRPAINVVRADGVPRRRGAAGQGRAVPRRRPTRSPRTNYDRNPLRRRQLRVQDEADHRARPPRAGGRAGDADDRSPRQRARRDRAEHRAPVGRGNPGADARRERRRAREGHHRPDRASSSSSWSKPARRRRKIC